MFVIGMSVLVRSGSVTMKALQSHKGFCKGYKSAQFLSTRHFSYGVCFFAFLVHCTFFVEASINSTIGRERMYMVAKAVGAKNQTAHISVLLPMCWDHSFVAGCLTNQTWHQCQWPSYCKRRAECPNWLLPQNISAVHCSNSGSGLQEEALHWLHFLDVKVRPMPFGNSMAVLHSPFPAVSEWSVVQAGLCTLRSPECSPKY